MILGIETAVDHVGVALGDHRGIRAHTMVASDRRHAESLTPMIRFAMQQAGVEMTDLSAIAVDVGPGLFTGMRVGMATAQSMAWALELPIVPVCSLDALAMNADMSEVTVAAALDARRGEVYWALYRMRGVGMEPQRLTEPVVTPPEDLAIHLADRAARHHRDSRAAWWLNARHDYQRARRPCSLRSSSRTHPLHPADRQSIDPAPDAQ
jgi:tRNA threonylcarbamoyladenosine biosynthesis protein TsaB